MTTTTLNALARASSAYLRSAMHQPVQWQEWGAEAFASAQRENKPMLLDIGAVWCHWCHVMDRESYDDPEVAAIVNEHFIAVKVDRDERPDIDSRYQAAVSAVSGQGGWPLTAFLTPDGKPFYGGTYFPPNDGYGRPSFKRVLISIANAYKDKHGDVVEQAKMVESAIVQAESFAGRGGRVSASIIAAIQKSAFSMFDAQHGGFGQAPKFPHPSALDLLIEQYARTGDERLRNLIVTTLEHMANGGVYDQLAGGFHRYSVDERWVVPHFEKMCYDNSELLKNYVHGYQATGSKFFAKVARDIIRWMDEWLSDRERGGFYASQDADISMDDDGDYFTWTLDEGRAVLTEEEAQVAALHYDINEIGEMHHNPAKNVLYVRAPIEEIARRMSLSAERVLSPVSYTHLIEKLPLRPVNILIGSNGSGKSNFIGVFAFLHAAREGRLRDYVTQAGGAEKVLHFGSKTTRQIEFFLSFGGEVNQYELALSPTQDDGLYPSSETTFFWDKSRYNRPWNDALAPREQGREAGISDPSLKRTPSWVRARLGGWRLYHMHDTSTSSPMRKTGKVDDNQFLRPDGSNLSAFLYYLQEKDPTSYSLIRRTIQRVTQMCIRDSVYPISQWSLAGRNR